MPSFRITMYVTAPIIVLEAMKATLWDKLHLGPGIFTGNGTDKLGCSPLGEEEINAIVDAVKEFSAAKPDTPIYLEYYASSCMAVHVIKSHFLKGEETVDLDRCDDLYDELGLDEPQEAEAQQPQEQGMCMPPETMGQAPLQAPATMGQAPSSMPR